MKLVSNFLALVIAISIFSCKKDNSLSGNPSSSKPTVNFQLKGTNPSSVVGRFAAQGLNTKTESNNIQWTAATASISMIKFEAKKAGTEVEIKSNVHQTVDLLNVSAVIGSLSIPAGIYNEVEFRVQLSPDGTNPALEVKGQFTTGTVTSNIIFQADETIEIRGEKANVTINDSTIHKAITSLNLSMISQGISLSSLINATKTNGDIIITSSINADLYKIIVKNLRELGEEEDFD
ncbi:MAG TPA: hypothetical protein VGO09_03530 [Flavisolibacter sp.]|nr:hypothetical protein [Flavisolibacter sp.]